MPPVTDITKSLHSSQIDKAFVGLRFDSHCALNVRPSKHQDLVSDDRLTAGIDFHHLLRRLNDRLPLSDKERAYFPYVAASRQYLFDELGVRRIIPDQRLVAVGSIGDSICDLKLEGGLHASRGVCEFKVVRRGYPGSPRGIDLAETGLYARMIAGRSDFDRVYAVLAYVDLFRHKVDVLYFRNAKDLIFRTVSLLKKAA
jgi:hypothetical protein